ncbi:gamma-glutamylcyclotransferase family protein [Verminephrobacter eiseniae]|nr:gamma-glutamylcyclotransferase family protein [Verminephrobacter eiseniae]
MSLPTDRTEYLFSYGTLRLEPVQIATFGRKLDGAPDRLPGHRLVSRHRSSVGLRWPSKRIAALHRLPIRSVLAARCALRCAPMAARSLRHLIRDATLALLEIRDAAVVRTSGMTHHPMLVPTGQPRDLVDGTVFAITPEELRHADSYEVADYRRERITLASGLSAWVYVDARPAAGTA